jgi:hypothetical protein
MARKAANTTAGLEQLEPEIRAQLESLGYCPDRVRYSASEVVASTKSALMTVETFMHHAWTELPEQRAVA